MRKTIACVSAAVMAVGLVAPCSGKPGPDEALTLLKEGNQRFVDGKATFGHADKARRELAAKSNQGDFAIATVVSCSDSRVPPEYLFDTGIMDLFVVRIAGNVCDTDEIGSVEYGVRHVKTPVLLVMGHSQCGAVTAVAKASLGEGHALEKNIPPLVDNIGPAVERVRKAFPQVTAENLVTRAIEENVWQGVKDLLTRSAAVRESVREGKVKLVAGIYELESGRVRWLSPERMAAAVQEVEADPAKEKEAMAGGHAAASHAPAHKEEPAPAVPAAVAAPAAHEAPKAEAAAAHATGH